MSKVCVCDVKREGERREGGMKGGREGWRGTERERERERSYVESVCVRERALAQQRQTES